MVTRDDGSLSSSLVWSVPVVLGYVGYVFLLLDLQSVGSDLQFHGQQLVEAEPRDCRLLHSSECTKVPGRTWFRIMGRSVAASLRCTTCMKPNASW